MNNIDKYIKLNFSLVKGELIGLICCSVFASLGVFLPSLAIVAVVLMVVMLVLIIRVYTKIYEKSLFKEEALLYQSLPISSEEIIVAKTFVGTAAATAAWIGLMGGASIGLALLNSSFESPVWPILFLNLLSEIGAPGALLVILQGVTEAFCLTSTIFALSAVFNCRPKIERSVLLRAVAVGVYVGACNLKEQFIPEFVSEITNGNLFFTRVVEIMISIAIGIAALFMTKHYLDKKYFLE